MNSKMIAIIAVMAMCGAALVGVGYAYQASLQVADNSIASDTVYITVKNDTTATGGNVVKYEATEFKPYYDSTTTSAGTTYEFNVTDSGSGWTLNGANYVKSVEKQVVLSIDLTEADVNDKFAITVTPSEITLPNYLVLSYTVEAEEGDKALTDYELSIPDSGSKVVTVTLNVVLTMTVLKDIPVGSDPVDDFSDTSFGMKYTVAEKAA